jgi:tetratricopeptide (TPR) repeat protein
MAEGHGGSVFQHFLFRMSKRSTDILFQLIHSLEKAEKRHFKLFIKRNSANENLKIVQLFDALDKLDEYDETRLLKKIPSVQKVQLSNLKAHLYKQVLASLRLLKSADSLDLQLNEQFDYAHILYKKGLFLQSLKILEKTKDLAKANQKFAFMVQAIALEKRIEALHITRSMQDRAESLSAEALLVSNHINMVTRLSNLAIQLYSWYIRHGHTRNEEDETAIKNFMKSNLPADAWNQTGFYESLYLYQSFTWYSFIRQDFIMYYRYTQKWVDIFDEHLLMKRVETGHYIKGLHNLLNAHFDLRHHLKIGPALVQLEAFSQTERVQENDNFRVQSFLYIAQAKINIHFLKGTFRQGLSLVPEIEAKLKDDALFIDPHRVMVLDYKIASLYFGSGDFDTCIDYLQKIINDDVGLRYDLQCYARLQHLLAHYELGSYELVEYLSRSVYRFMAKMKNLTLLEEEILKFLRRSFSLSPDKIKTELQVFLQRIKKFERNRFQTRVFVYLDIVSWVESKVYQRPLSEIIHKKYLADLERRSRKNLPNKA